jgi:demethylmenaquinone methyltransferase/2-methoxy-6-polyprenyl-1,4-benzoquinol methylase
MLKIVIFGRDCQMSPYRRSPEMKDRDLIDKMKIYYDRRAPLHDRYMNYSDNRQMEELLGPIIESVNPHINGRKVLEIACGTGNWTEVLARRADSVIAVDSSSTALEIAARKFRHLNNVTFKKADAYRLDDISGSFDVAFSSDWWSHMPVSSINSFLKNLHHRLKKESRVICIDMMTREEFEKETVYYDDDGNRVSLRALPDGSEFEVIKNFPSKNDLFKILGGLGDDISYHEFENLKRWMITYTPEQL